MFHKRSATHFYQAIKPVPARKTYRVTKKKAYQASHLSRAT